MKKVLSRSFIVISAILTICLCACAPHEATYKATYNSQEILKIETVWNEGFAPFTREFVRTFDFQHGKVIDIWKADETDLDKENRNQYNNPKEIATFTEKQGQTLIDKIGTLGFFDWEKEYKTNDEIHDAGAHRVLVYFADGTEKSTVIYFLEPPNYKEIKNAIEDAFGVTMYVPL